MKRNQKIPIIALLIITLLIIANPFFIPNSQADNPVSSNGSFSIMQISDTQFLSLSSPQLFKDTTNWIINNAANYNLKMVVHTGDIVDNINGTSGTYSDPVQWDNANTSMSLLLNAGIPYCWDAGNHDQIPWNDANGTWLGSSYAAFNATNMHSKPYWVGDFYDSKNTAVRFTYKSYDFLIINLEYMASNTTISWMKTLLDNNKGANVIIAAHTYLNKGGGYGFASTGLPGEVAWCNNFKTILDGYPNIFLTLSGHDPTGTANMTRVGNREEIFFNRQSATTLAGQTGAAAVRIYTFNLTSMQVNTSTYSLDTQTWLTTASNQFTFNTALNRNDWVLVNDARLVKGSPDLREYIWQKNASMAPNGPWDKIGLHRLIKTGITPKGVVFMLPGLYGSGERLVSNPPTDSFTKTENMSQCTYWANKGFDVYTIDYRNHFIPINFNKSQLSFTADWGMEQFMSDIKEAVDKAKEVSGTKKVFIAGQSWGGILAQIYAAKYWQQDLRGLVLLDPGPMKSTITKNQNLTNSYNVTTVVNTMMTAGAWLFENPQQSATVPSPLNPGYIFLVQFAAQNPGAPAQYLNGTLVTTINPRTNRIWTNITEWFEYQWNPNSFNTYGGYSDITIDMNLATQAERYYPFRVFIDYAAMLDWAVCPYLSYDYFAHANEINVPVLAFRSGLNLAAFGNITNGMATTDFTWMVLPNYGHSDVFQGTYSARDVSEPAYQWMVSHYPLLTAAATPTTLTVVTGQTATFTVNAAGTVPPYTYQWYQETNLLTGQTKPQISLPTTKNNENGQFTYYCKITDAENKTTNSNTIILIVQAPQPTPTTAPTSTPTPPTSTPMPTPTSTPQVTTQPSPTATSSTIETAQNLNLAYAIIATTVIVLIVGVALLLKKRAKN